MHSFVFIRPKIWESAVCAFIHVIIACHVQCTVQSEAESVEFLMSRTHIQLFFKSMWWKRPCQTQSPGWLHYSRSTAWATASWLNGRWRSDQAHSFLPGTKWLLQAPSHMSARCFWPHSPSKKQLGTIIATYKWISSMIKMFGVGGEQDAQPGGCNLDGSRSGVLLKGGKGKKNLQSCLFRHLWAWTSVPAPSLFAVCLPYQWMHLSLNTTLMKVIRFNGASFRTPAIKVCATFDWEVVEILWWLFFFFFQINSSLAGQWASKLHNLVHSGGKRRKEFTSVERSKPFSIDENHI